VDVLGSNPRASPFNTLLQLIFGTLLHLAEIPLEWKTSGICHQYGRTTTRFGDIYISLFEFSVARHHWEFSHSHVVAHDWATWKPIIDTCHLIVQSVCLITYFPCHPTTCRIDAMSSCHIVYGCHMSCTECHMEHFHWSTCQPEKYKNE
jgi:hypothetical protein